MSTQVDVALRGRNPDVVTCIANLSNDEVFTPPEIANRMLDTLAEAGAAADNGANLWADKTVKFLDPFTKSGVFLREITSRLTKGYQRSKRITSAPKRLAPRYRKTRRFNPIWKRYEGCAGCDPKEPLARNQHLPLPMWRVCAYRVTLIGSRGFCYWKTNFSMCL
jgi:hypothetical protein